MNICSFIALPREATHVLQYSARLRRNFLCSPGFYAGTAGCEGRDTETLRCTSQCRSRCNNLRQHAHRITDICVQNPVALESRNSNWVYGANF